MGIYCDTGFDIEDSNNKGYSLRELDFYQWIPAEMRKIEKNHSFSLRKNLNTGLFELYRNYFDTKEILVVFSTKDLQEALDTANRIWNTYHSKWSGQKRERDTICEHKPPNLDSSFCKIYEKQLTLRSE